MSLRGIPVVIEILEYDIGRPGTAKSVAATRAYAPLMTSDISLKVMPFLRRILTSGTSKNLNAASSLKLTV
jgi:hypothetical protein